jgi:hypothetical protein
MAPTNEGPFVVSEPCPVCDGQGTINGGPCPTCRGTGVQRFYHGTKAALKPGDLIEPVAHRLAGALPRSAKAMKDRVEGARRLGIEAIDD